jgi:hypothetical protein
MMIVSIQPPTIACDQPQRDAQHHGEQHRRNADEQRNARAVQNGRENIAALIVGPQPEHIAGELVLRHGRGKPVHQIESRRIERIVGRDQRREEGRQPHQNHHHGGGHRDRALAKRPGDVGVPPACEAGLWRGG